MLLSPCIISILATMASVLIKPLGNYRGGWGKRLTCMYKTDHPIYLIIKFFLFLGYPLVNIHMGHEYLHAFGPFRKVYPHTFPLNFVSQILQSCFIQVHDHSNFCPRHKNMYIVTHVTISLSKQSEQPGALLEVLTTSKISLHSCSLWMSQKGAIALQVSTFWWYLYIVQNHL